MTANAATAVTYAFARTAEKLALPYALIMAWSSRARCRTASWRGFSAMAALVAFDMFWFVFVISGEECLDAMDWM